MSARKVAMGVAVILAVPALVASAVECLDREAGNRERLGREWCARSSLPLAGCPAPVAPSPAAVDRRAESDQIAAQIVAACDRAARARLYVKACDSIVND